MTELVVATGKELVRIKHENDQWLAMRLSCGQGMQCLAVDPRDPERWYVSANPGARLAHHSDKNAEAHIYRWHGRGPWEALGRGLPEPLDSFPYALAMNARSLFAGLGDGRIYRSEGRGEHWSQLTIHVDTPSRIVALTTLDRIIP
ncbi:MAG TPA: hypothetical protein PLR25_19180 [Planctomycetaceae bacterium]|nr:hypothetical protein [Planctomycetaceae bacterium]